MGYKHLGLHQYILITSCFAHFYINVGLLVCIESAMSMANKELFTYLLTYLLTRWPHDNDALRIINQESPD